MIDLLKFIVLAVDPEAPNGAPIPEGPPIWNMLIPAAAIMFVFILMSSPKRRDQARRDESLKNLKKNDRVVTIGGIFGSVVSVSTDGKEVTLKVDDSTRIKFRKTAIADVLGDETPAEAAPKST